MFSRLKALRAVIILVTSISTVLAGCTTTPKSGRPVAGTDLTRPADADNANSDDNSRSGDDEPAAWRIATAEPDGDECVELQVIPCMLQVAEVEVPILGLGRFCTTDRTGSRGAPLRPEPTLSVPASAGSP